MALLGMLCLGFFIGGIVTLGFKSANTLTGWGTLVSTGIAAALGGASLTFIDRYSSSIGPAIFFYPVGLALMVPWYYVGNLADMIARKGNGILTTTAGIVGMLLLVVVTGWAIVIAVGPAHREAKDWMPHGDKPTMSTVAPH